MYLLDTNILSELMRDLPNPVVKSWFETQDAHQIFLCAPTEAELRFGTQNLPLGKRRSLLQEKIDIMLARLFSERVLPFDSAAAQSYATVLVTRRALGRPIAVMDAQIAAIALSRNMTLVTRNLRDFDGLQHLPLIDPFAALP